MADTPTNSYGSQIPAADLASFQKANPGLTFGAQDLAQYNAAGVQGGNPNAAFNNLAGQTITSAALAPTPSLNYQTPNPTPVYPTATLTPPLAPTGPEKTANDLTASITGLNAAAVGESAYRSSQETAQGIPALNQTITDLNGRLSSLSNEALALPQQLQLDVTGKGITAGGLAPIQTAALRNNAIQALGVKSLLEAAQGNLSTAQQFVDRAVAQKYDPIKEEIAAKTANLDLILKSPAYSLADKNRAQTQKDQQDAQARSIKYQEDAMSTAHAMAAAALKLNPNDSTAAFNAQQVLKLDPSDPSYLDKVYQLVGSYQTDPVATQKALTDLKTSQEQLKEAPQKFASDQALKTAQIAEAQANAKKTIASIATANNQDPTVVQGWVSNIKNGTAKLSDLTGNPDLKNAVVTALATGGNSQSDILSTTQQSLKELTDMVNGVGGYDGFQGAVGAKGFSSFFGLRSTPLPGTPAANFDLKLKQVTNDVILPNLNLLHGLGRVTDREFKALTSAVTSLSTDSSEEAFKTELANITDRINAKAAEASQNQDAASAVAEPADHSKGAVWQRSDGTYVSDGTQWVKK